MTDHRASNNAAAVRCTLVTAQDDFAAFEALPASIRAYLRELVVKLDAASVLAYYRSITFQARARGGSAKDAEAWALFKLAQLEGQEIDAFAALHWGGHSPHIAADVSVQRYGGARA